MSDTKDKPKVVTQPTRSKAQNDELIDKLMQAVNIIAPNVETHQNAIAINQQNIETIVKILNQRNRKRWWQVWRKEIPAPEPEPVEEQE